MSNTRLSEDYRFLLHLVDVVWQTALESDEVPSTDWALRMIADARNNSNNYRKEINNMNNFENELRELLNRYSEDNAANTPDYVLAEYLAACLEAYKSAVKRATTKIQAEPRDLLLE